MTAAPGHAPLAWPGAPLCPGRDSAPGLAACYRLGDGYLRLSADGPAFLDRFDRIFHGCRTADPADATLPVLGCHVEHVGSPTGTVVCFADPEPLDVGGFLVMLFADRGCRVQPPEGTRVVATLGHGVDAVRVTGDDERLHVEGDADRDAVVGSLAVHRLLRLQRDVAVLHAAAVAIEGRAVAIVGGKGSGKTTTALALAARGHGLFGDELTAVRLSSRHVVGIRRAVSVRPGPRAVGLDEALAHAPVEPVTYPDGSQRTRAAIDALFPGTAPASTRLDGLCFLRRFADRPAVEPFVATREHLQRLTPLPSSLWAYPAPVRALRLLDLLGRTPCWWVDVADPDDTAALLDRTVSETWH